VPHANLYHAPVFSKPDDNAPPDVLARYWAQLDSSDNVTPSEAVRRKLLDFCEGQPAFLPSLLSLLPADDDANARIKRIYDNNTALGKDWQEKVREHLKSHSIFFRDELFAEAQVARDDDKNGEVQQSDELTTLAKLDWPRAEPLLKKFATGNQPRTAVLAQTLMYRHFANAGDEPPASVLRAQLKQVVADKKAPGYSRDIAANALLETNWPGRDEWYLVLFHDPTLSELRDGDYLRDPLSGPVYRDPDHWIPIMTRLVNDPDRAVHNAAVSCLIGFHLRSGRRDALEPLLPWLMDPKWSSARDRLRLIQTVDDLEMKESIPGLIAVLQEKGDPYDRSYAAQSLAHFRDPRAVPALRIALAREKEADHRRRIIQALVACGGIPATDGAKAVEAFAIYTLTPQNQQKWDEYEYSFGKSDVPAEVAVGAYIARNGPENDPTVELLVKRIEELKSKQTPLAAHLQSLIAPWESRSADQAVLRHIRDYSITAEALAAALERRDLLQKNVNAELHDLENTSGATSGFAAVLLADRQKELAILKNNDDRPAATAVLAAARLVRDPLPIPDLRELPNSGNALLDAALDGYLQANDSPEARRFYLERHKGEARILGARQSFDPGHHSFRDFDKLEEELRDETRDAETGSEIYALLSAGYWGNAGQIIIRASAKDAKIMYIEDRARYYSRTLTGAEWQQFQNFLTDNHIEDLGPLNLAAWDGMQYEYVHLARDGGRRVFMNNPGEAGSGGTAYDRLCAFFRDLLDAAPLELHYRSAGKMAGFEVLVADPRYAAFNPWVHGNDFRLRIYVRSTGAASSHNGLWSVHTDAREYEFTWVGLRNGELIAADPPAAFPEDDPEKIVPEELEKERKEHGSGQPMWPLSVAGKAYRLAEWHEKNGLWQFAHNQQPRLIAQDEFKWPVITPDGEWAFLAACKKTWAEPNFVVRINLNTGKSFRLKIAEADRIKPLTYIAARQRVLITRYGEGQHSDHRDPVGPATPEFLLVDPSTGEAEIVHGEFAPLEEPGARPLQPSTAEGRFWAAIYREAEMATEIGLYDPAQFAFIRVISVPGLDFSSDEMWVDEVARKAYIVYKHQTLRINVP
jgi:hypothetical protein